MALNVITNFAANIAQRNVAAADAAATSSLAKLSSGLRVVSAKDDAASLAIGSRLNAEVQAMKQANVNAVQATSMLQIADGALAKVGDILVRMKTLAVQAGSGQLSNVERGMLDTEYQSLLSEIDRIANDTEFAGTQLIAGAAVTGTSLNGQSSANNFVQAADGFQNIAFDATVTSSGATTAVFTFSYNSTTNVLTATNVTKGTSEGINVGSAAIAVNGTQTVNFSNLGATVTLNSAFDKTADVAPASATAFTSDASGAIEATSISLVTANNAAVSGLSSNSVAIDATAASGATLTLGVLTASVNLTTIGTKTVSFAASDSSSQSLTVSFNVTTAFSNGESAASLGFSVGDLGTLALGTFGTSNTSFTFKLGTGTVANVDSLTISVDQITTSALSISGTDVTTATNADTASNGVTAAIDSLNIARANIGASQNRLEFASANLASAIENADAARSGLLDLDVAREMTVFTSKQILVQLSVSMLAQANQLPQNLLRLFR